MNGKQKERFEKRLQEYGASTEITPGIEALIWTLACVEIEEETLQDYVNENGTCYAVVGNSGDIYNRARPEWQQLKEARLRKQALIAKIEQKAKGVEEKETDVETYFG
jgi:hypothetical protein